MQFSESWLRSLVDPPFKASELAHLLTMAGLEVESLTPVAPPFRGVVVGQVTGIEQHPNADKLKLCRVDVGDGTPRHIVCGAPNVAIGMKAPCALAGTELPGMKIQLAKVRGVESQGMLCSAHELGLSEDHSGLLALPPDAPIGRDVRDWLDLDDNLFTLKLTPNRADCLSLIGLAREVSALTGMSWAAPEAPVVKAVSPTRRDVLLDAPQACPRYLGRVISAIDARAPTPEWMRRRIERSGLRCISAVVDVTNYVMLELGQPLHAFDNARLEGAVHARFPRPGERLTLLNGQVVEPAADTLLIADDARALALAGIMGGEESGISLDTTELFLESAFFSPEAIAGRARALGFSSDASYRFERGVDFEGPLRAIERATQLILDICGGEAGPVTDATAVLPKREMVRLRPARVCSVLGVELDETQMVPMLESLGLTVSRDESALLVAPPSYRFDIAIEEDLIEELARVHGYENIPVPAPRAALAMLPQPEAIRSACSVKRVLVERDYLEVITFSFVDEKWERDLAGNEDPIRLANPIAAQMSVMRSSLIGGLVGTLAANLKRQADRVRCFEVGRCFRKNSGGEPIPGFDQPLRVAALAWGTAWPEQWGAGTRRVDFFDAKADVEALIGPADARFDPVIHPALHPGRAAAVTVNGHPVGVIGELHPAWIQEYELGSAPVVFELDLSPLLRREVPSHRILSRFPAVVRDLALVLRSDLPAEAVLDGLREAAPAIVTDIRLFDVYQGKGIETDKKSLAFRVVMQDTERTLADSEADAAVAHLMRAAEERFSARLRG